ncbi:hypothetical protein KP509_04G106600 [Ceratopteris richardii]|uniref:Uncharacterized protein n=1 Tax=Ceratopteris richardii TaxID=49495 RepID=A0A8T2V3N6_CERRI|nr:hypothetical protein KP509_04G106600 [Ceratopteris richardii]
MRDERVMEIISTALPCATLGDGHPRQHLSDSASSRAFSERSNRRALLASSFSGALVAASLSTSIPEYPPKSQLIEELLERSRANKTKNDQKRLESYYERNFKEYFEFIEGTIKNKSDLTDAEKGILKWLEKSRSKKK